MAQVPYAALLLLFSTVQSARFKRRNRAETAMGKYVVIIGDSYSAGTGIHLYGDEYDEEMGGSLTLGNKTYTLTTNVEGGCWRDTTTTPGRVLADKLGISYINYACKGAQVLNVEEQFDYILEKYPEIRWRDSMIILTAGGNDVRTDTGIRWPQVIRKCILEWDDCHENPEHQPHNYNEVKTSVQDLLVKIATKAPGARIRLLGYPELMHPRRGFWRRCPGWATISGDEAIWADGRIDVLNKELELAVANAKDSSGEGVDLKFLPVDEDFKTGACDWAPKDINAVLLNAYGVSDCSFHPTQFGYDAYLQTVLKDLNMTS